MNLANILTFFGISSNATHKEIFISSVVIDSRNALPGSLFIALAGESFDGHDFISAAFQNGACAALVSDVFAVSPKALEIQKNYPTQILISVPNPQKAFQDLSIWYRTQYLNFPLLALTGSSGKTSTKEMLTSILKKQYTLVFSTPGNKNNHLGVPLSLLNCPEKTEVAVFELGANHMGEIFETVQWVRPKAALINNIGVAHIGEFGGIENIFKAKTEIFSGLDENGTAIYNADDAFCEQWEELLKNKKTLTFGLSEKAQIRATHIKFDNNMCASFIYNNHTITLCVPGEHNVMNALAAIALASTLNVSNKAIIEGLSEYKGYSGRLENKNGLNNARVLDDTYNANLKSVEAAMHVLAGFNGKRLLVLGDLAELGSWEIEHYRTIGQLASDLKLDGVITCGEKSRHVLETFHGLSSHHTDFLSLIDTIKPLLNADTTVVVKGSRSSRMENVVKAITTG